MVKRYLALVHGRPAPEQGTIQRAHRAATRAHRQRMAVVAGGREAVSDYRLLEGLGAWSLLEVHHPHRPHPPDPRAPGPRGAPRGGRPGVRRAAGGEALPPGARLDRQFLHAAVLGFRLPSTGEYCEFRAELPRGTARGLLAALRVVVVVETSHNAID